MKTRREKVLSHTFTHTTLPYFNYRLPALGLFAILMALPAMSYGCTSGTAATAEETVGTSVRLTSSAETVPSSEGTLDIFTFNDDPLQRLDSYTRTSFHEGDVDVTSQKGSKIIFFCANGQRERYSWTDMNSLAMLGKTEADLTKESKDRPLMTGMCRATAGEKVTGEVVLKPLMSEVVLRSIRCDFTGRPYADAVLTDAKVYLTNVNARCSLNPGDTILPSRTVNTGMLNESDMAEFSDPDMLFREIADEIGPKESRPGIVLSCYPNTGAEESIGTPFTRLVIEGKVEGRTFYWPININRSGPEGNGVGRNCRYEYDITIRRKGSESPDFAIGIADIDINMEVKEWEEKEEYGILF